MPRSAGLLTYFVLFAAAASVYLLSCSCFVRGPAAFRRPAAPSGAGGGSSKVEGSSGQRTLKAVDATVDPPVRTKPAETITEAGGSEPELLLGAAKKLPAAKATTLIEQGQVSKAVIVSWDDAQVLLQLRDGGFATVMPEEVDIESFRDTLVSRGVPCRYPQGEKELMENATLDSEGVVAGGTVLAAAIGLADIVLEIGGPLALSGGSLNAELAVQSLIEGKTIEDTIMEDQGLLEKDITIAERFAQKLPGDVSNQATASFGELTTWLQDAWAGLLANHAPGIGGWIEDSFMGFLVAVSLYSLYQMAFLKRKANTFSGFAHTATGAMQIVTVVYAIIEERCFREAPGPIWAVFTFAIFMINNITMWPLLKYFRGTEVQRVLFKLAYSFIISFQGIHAIAWSIQYPWLYWVVMPFWFYSVKKLFESSDNILALLPENTIPIAGLQDGARRRVKGIQNDAPTYAYSILNFAGAVFDNLYMFVYTWRGPAGFWGWSAANIPAVNDHLRTGLVKPSFGSLTISVLVFLATLVTRKMIDQRLAVALNVILASVGPWLILYYHKLVDWDEPWQPEIMGDWGSTPYFVNNFNDLLNLPSLIAAGPTAAPVLATAAGAATAAADAAALVPPPL